MIVLNFTWNDLPALVEFITLVRSEGGDERLVSLPSLREEMAQPGLNPEENCFLFEDDQGLRAYSILHPEVRLRRAVLELGIHPGHKGNSIEKDIIRSALAHSKALGARVLHLCLPPSATWINLLEREGFSRIRDYWVMVWQQESVPPVELSPGFIIESHQPGDEERLTRVQNAAFGGSWGFCPNTVEEVRYRAGMSSSSPEGILFLTQGDETAGYCWTRIQGESQGPIGVIGMIGIVPDFRGQGLGRPILLAGMEYLHSQGVKQIRLDVDGENGPAIKLYNSAGFHKARELHWFEVRLPGA